MVLHTVNVVEYYEDTIREIWSYTDDAEGNKEAEKLFQELAFENNVASDDIEVGLEDGYVEGSNGYRLYLTHS